MLLLHCGTLRHHSPCGCTACTALVRVFGLALCDGRIVSRVRFVVQPSHPHTLTPNAWRYPQVHGGCGHRVHEDRSPGRYPCRCMCVCVAADKAPRTPSPAAMCAVAYSRRLWRVGPAGPPEPHPEPVLPGQVCAVCVTRCWHDSEPIQRCLACCYCVMRSSPYVLSVGATQLVNASGPGPAANTSITLPAACFQQAPPNCAGGFIRPVICPPCSTSTTEAPVAGWSGGGFSLFAPAPRYGVASGGVSPLAHQRI